ncbi:hypothetical protein KKD37_01255 [Patescibacteria group bacterium]|nr:hypothetical protein [Patescibacteria group bacterium]
MPDTEPVNIVNELRQEVKTEETLRKRHQFNAVANASAVVEQHVNKINVASKVECAFWGLYSYLESIYPNQTLEQIEDKASQILTFDRSEDPELFFQQQSIIRQHPNSSIIGITAHILTQQKRTNEINPKILNPSPEMLKNFKKSLGEPNPELVGKALDLATHDN